MQSRSRQYPGTSPLSRSKQPSFFPSNEEWLMGWMGLFVLIIAIHGFAMMTWLRSIYGINVVQGGWGISIYLFGFIALLGMLTGSVLRDCPASVFVVAFFVYVVAWVFIVTIFDLAAWKEYDGLLYWNFIYVWRALLAYAGGRMLVVHSSPQRLLLMVFAVAGMWQLMLSVDFNTMQLDRSFRGPGWANLSIKMSDAAIVLGFSAAMWGRNKTYMLVMLLITLSYAFFSWSRTAVFGVAAGYLVIGFLVIFAARERWYSRFLPIALIAVSLVGFALQIEDPTTHRVTRWIYAEADSSLEARDMMFQEGLNIIAQNPVLGSLGSEIAVLGHGAFMHTHLEAWRQYGLLPFLLLVAVGIYAIYSVISGYLRDPTFQTATMVGFLVTLLLMMALSRTIGYYALWFGIGAVLARAKFARQGRVLG